MKATVPIDAALALDLVVGGDRPPIRPGAGTDLAKVGISYVWIDPLSSAFGRREPVFHECRRAREGVRCGVDRLSINHASARTSATRHSQADAPLREGHDSHDGYARLD